MSKWANTTVVAELRSSSAGEMSGSSCERCVLCSQCASGMCVDSALLGVNAQWVVARKQHSLDEVEKHISTGGVAVPSPVQSVKNHSTEKKGKVYA